MRVVAVASDNGGRPSTVVENRRRRQQLRWQQRIRLQRRQQWRDSRDLRFKLNASQPLMEYAGL